MQLKNITRKFFAVLLIVVFSVKAGTGLYLHNSLHVKNSAASSQSTSTEIKYSCSCISDFYLPFTEIAQQKIIFPSFTYGEHTFFYTSSLLVTFSIFHSLRAPPINS